MQHPSLTFLFWGAGCGMRMRISLWRVETSGEGGGVGLCVKLVVALHYNHFLMSYLIGSCCVWQKSYASVCRWLIDHWLNLFSYFLSVGTHRCEPITISFCQNMPYTTTQFPNFLKHRSQDDAKLAIKRKFDRLLKSKCSPDMAPFLCSILAPPCNGTQKPVSPCKELCKRAMKSCRKELQRFGINLGSAMKCRNHPKEATSQCFNGSWPKNTIGKK